MPEPTTDASPTTAGAHELDVGRSPAEVARVRGVAADVAARHGVELSSMRRAHGFSNTTWVGGGIAVRVGRDVAEVEREWALVRALPAAVGHPSILETGASEGRAWTVTREIAGVSLHAAWPTLSPTAQRDAVERLWACAVAMHEATASLRTWVDTQGGFVPATIEEARDRATVIGAAAELPAGRRGRLDDMVCGFFQEAPQAQQVVNHGDLALMNALWDGSVALLDIECAVLGPVEIDLCRLALEVLVGPDGDLVRSEAAEAVGAIAAAYRRASGSQVLLRGAAVLDQLRDLDLVMTTGASGRTLVESRPGRLLLGLLEEDGGYLRPLLS